MVWLRKTVLHGTFRCKLKIRITVFGIVYMIFLAANDKFGYDKEYSKWLMK